MPGRITGPLCARFLPLSRLGRRWDLPAPQVARGDWWDGVAPLCSLQAGGPVGAAGVAEARAGPWGWRLTS